MASYDSLTPGQKADLAAYDQFLRSAFAGLAKVAKSADIPTWEAFAAANVDPVLATLDAGSVVPNHTNYAGAKDLTLEEFLGLQAIARGLVAMLGDHRPLIVKAIGINS